MAISNYNQVGITVIVVGGIASFLAIITVALRVWARKLSKSSLDASDWTCFGGLIIALVLYGSTINGVSQGLGLPVDQVSSKQLVQFNKSLLVGIFTWTASNTLIRMPMIQLYIRVLPTRGFVILCWIFLVENLVCALATYLTICVICTPFAFYWDHSIPGGQCGDLHKFYTWNGIQNILHDIITVMMPMPILWSLRLPTAKKISLVFVFGLGLSICALTLTLTRTIQIVRTSSLHNVTEAYASVGALSMLEPLLGSINYCLPLLRPVAQRLGLFLGFSQTHENTSHGRPSLLKSIGSKRTRLKPHDPLAFTTSNFHDEECLHLVRTEVNKNSTSQEPIA